MADLYRVLGKEAEAEHVLRRAIEVIPRSAGVHHALGLSLVRQKRTPEALEELRLVATLDRANARCVYAYAAALNSTGKPEEAVMVLRSAHHADPNNVEILTALVAFHRDMDNEEAACIYASKLRALSQWRRESTTTAR